MRGRSLPPCLACGLACALASVALTARADEPSKGQCISANEDAQSLRQAGKLQAARAHLLVCVSKSCPGPVRDDCTIRLDEVEKATPTIVFVARGDDGNDLSAVSVKMDGTVLADRLDGMALKVDPGEHAFEFSAEGRTPVSKRLVIRETVKGRQEVIVFAAPQKIGPPPAPQQTTAAPGAPHPSSGNGGRRAPAYVLGGAGIVAIGVGAFFGLQAISQNNAANCDGNNFCDNPQSRIDAQGSATLSTIAFGAGAALLAGGILFLLLTPSKAPPPPAAWLAGTIGSRTALP
jgi:hypothetical protein